MRKRGHREARVNITRGAVPISEHKMDCFNAPSVETSRSQFHGSVNTQCLEMCAQVPLESCFGSDQRPCGFTGIAHRGRTLPLMRHWGNSYLTDAVPARPHCSQGLFVPW